MSWRLLPLALCPVTVGMLLPSPVLGADSSSVSASSKPVNADFISTSGSNADLYLENKVSFGPLGLPEVGAVLDALGFGGGYFGTGWQPLGSVSDGAGISLPRFQRPRR